ncbi:MAG TPA: S16 family serine protease [Gaiellaceae bacterium]|nr:S16 family serine protease [Gaiellaceae bacterium]
MEAAVHPEPRSRRRWALRVLTPTVALTVGAILLLCVIGLELTDSNEYIFLPDQAHPVAPLVSVAGSHPQTGPGGIYFVDVIVRKATMLEKLFGGLHSGSTLVPADEVVPTGVSSSEENQVDVSEMQTSQQVAAAVALRALGKKVTTTANGALVAEIEPGFPASSKLRLTDLITAIDGTPVRSPVDVTGVMSGRPIGTTFHFTVKRAGKTQVVPITTVAAGKGSKRGVVGVILEPDEQIHLPIRVSIDSHGVSGPSAGLAFALDVMQSLGRNVDRGHKIAATGEIALDGTVGPIGGIKQKTIGAREAGVDVFLVPKANAATARKYAHGLRIIPVKNFQQALQDLATLP